jgi:hypothetical protein
VQNIRPVPEAHAEGARLAFCHPFIHIAHIAHIAFNLSCFVSIVMVFIGMALLQVV